MLIDVDLSKVNKNALVIVSNNRQVLAFKKTWHLQKPDKQLPKIFAWQAYLRHNYQKIKTKKRLLSPSEIRLLLTQAIQKTQTKTTQALIDEVVKHYDYLGNHCVQLADIKTFKEEIFLQFSTWIEDYQQKKRHYKVVDIHDLPALFNPTEKIEIWIYGFKTLTPVQEKILQKTNYQTLTHSKTFQYSYLSYTNVQEEIRAIAHWAKNLYQKNPQQSIAIVCPQLKDLQPLLKSTFDQVFDNLLIETGKKSYNISLGLPLSRYPLIQDLLAVLSLSIQINAQSLELSTLTQVLKSVYITGYTSERCARHQLINQLLTYSSDEFSLDFISKKLNKCPIFCELLTHIKLCQSNTLEQHLIIFDNLLNSWGFASKRPLSSNEYQLFNKYLESSLVLNQLTHYYNKLSQKKALQSLNELCEKTLFQAQSAPTHIQILGTLEAEGLRFDHAWVMGMNQDFLPAPLNTPRFIPTQLSQQHHIPHSTYELVQSDMHNTLNNLKNLASTVVFSYAFEQLGQMQLASNLLDINPVLQKHKPLPTQPILCETKLDAQAPPLQNLQVNSGVDLLKSQLLCPFKGFAKRLNLHTFEPAHLGLDRREQGSLLHWALHYFYQTICSKSQLTNLNSSELSTLIEQVLIKALEKITLVEFAKLEKIRLTHLMHKVIEYDRMRHDFNIIATEKTVLVNIKGLKFKTKIDRLEQMPDGSQIIFDYKTSKQSLNQWCNTYIQEPQLPLYAISNQSQGIAFIEILPHEIRMLGLAENPAHLPKPNANKCLPWKEQQTSWQKQLEQASQDFQQGRAKILPKKGACLYCEHANLCRIDSKV
jgi:probable DNA repair protein